MSGRLSHGLWMPIQSLIRDITHAYLPRFPPLYQTARELSSPFSSFGSRLPVPPYRGVGGSFTYSYDWK